MRKHYSPLIGAALAAASLFHFSLPAFAIGTSAGTNLVNSATATYDDAQNNSYDVISNQVTVTVGKIAGITNVPSGFTDNTTAVDNTEILPNDSVSFDFEVTNTGNDVSNIFIPSSSNIAVENLIITGIQYSTDDGATFTDRPADGIIPNVDENTSIIVRVTGDVSATAAEGDSISVQLGNTGTNTADLNSTDFPGTQNQPDVDATATGDVQAQDVRTLTSGTATVSGAPVNGQREASATQIVTVGSASLAMPRIEKVNAGVDDGADPNSLSDNIITYNLNLEVAGDSDAQVQAYTDFPYNAGDLEGRDYSGGAAGAGTPATFSITGLASTDQTNLILVSDAIPENTTLDPATVESPGVNWIPVYTDDPLTIAADEAQWTDDATSLTTNPITRVGWVYDARESTNGAIAAGTTVTGFTFDVITTGLTNTATAIYNVAQTFGSTDNGATGTGGLIAYDESGDQNPANLNDDGTFGPDETAFTTVGGNNLYGYADPDVNNDGTNDNLDPNNNNTGTGEAGEVNTITVALDAVASNILNGPTGSPAATGDIFDVVPADDNHDFQNLAAPSPTDANPLTETTPGVNGYDNSTYDPDAVVYTNTVRNPGTSAINNVILEPVSPEDLGLSGTAADLPTGTEVTITYNAQTATYLYDNATGTFTIQAGATGTGTDGTVVIPTIALQSNVSYTVSVDLPAGTSLSTNYVDGDPANDLVGGFPVPIVAYLDPDGDGLTFSDDGDNTNDDIYNVTVDQVYTGYLQLVKEARVLRDNGSGYVVVAGMGYSAPDSAKQPAPGDILEYRITYTNISEDLGSGTGSVLLQADDIEITEDGTIDGNNWALNNDSDTLMDTLHVLDGADDSTTGSVIRYFNAAGASSTNQGAFSNEVNDFGVTDDITKYVVNGITRVSPSGSGSFTFQRKITSEEDIENLAP